jgi:hypothetical protein
VVLSNLRLGETTVDLSVQRRGSAISLQLINSHGKVRVSALYS